MSTLQKMILQEKELIAFIKQSADVTDTTLQKHFCTEDFDKYDLYEVVDNLIYEKRIERTYPKESQVPVYVTVV